MAHKIIWSPEAVADLTEIRDYVARDSDAYAAALVERILSSIDRLSDFPNLGQRVPELDDDFIRQLIVDRYRVIYRVRAQAVDLAAIVHGARDLPRALAGRGL
jgi:addiction module RelE/StbE family toxin